LKESKAELIKENEKLMENDKSKEASHNKLQIENSNLQNQVKDLSNEKIKLQDSLNSKIKDQDDLINSQDLMRKEIEKLKEEKNTILKDNEKITTTLKTEVSELNKKILNYKEQIEELNKKIDEPKKNSKIVNFKPTEHYLIDEIKCNKLIEWIGKDVKFELIYRATDNGFKAIDFHKLCDKKGPTLVVVLTNHGKLIGGYTTIDWDGTVGYDFTYVKDNTSSSFLFSLTLNKKYKLKSEQAKYAIANSANHGPKFGGGHDLEIVSNCNTSENFYSYMGHTYESEDKSLFYGSEKFLVKNYEVYKVI
jgi:hypothetical protein